MKEVEIVALVKNYVPSSDGDRFSSLCGFKKILRDGFKKVSSDTYFSKSPVGIKAKNMGCYLFGQPHVWEGILRLKCNGHDVSNTLTILVDKWRTDMDIDEIGDLLKPVLEYLQEHGYIFAYDLLQDLKY